MTKEDWETLKNADQLRASQTNGDAFVGFKEREIDFAPTFKVQRQVGTEYKKQRTPSFCDRILWKSMPQHEGELHLNTLRPVPNVSTSDHKPVVATFQLTPAGGLPRLTSIMEVPDFFPPHAGEEAGQLRGRG